MGKILINTKRCLALVLALALCMGILYKNEAVLSAKSSPKLNAKKVTLYVGGKKTLKLKKATKVKQVKWTSNKKSVAKIKKKGKKKAVVMALKKGKAVITCKVKLGKKKYTLKCKVTVKNGRDGQPPVTAEVQKPTALVTETAVLQTNGADTGEPKGTAGQATDEGAPTMAVTDAAESSRNPEQMSNPPAPTNPAQASGNPPASTKEGQVSGTPVLPTNPGQASGNPSASKNPGQVSDNPAASKNPGQVSNNPSASANPGQVSGNPPAPTNPTQASSNPPAPTNPVQGSSNLPASTNPAGPTDTAQSAAQTSAATAPVKTGGNVPIATTPGRVTSSPQISAGTSAADAQTPTPAVTEQVTATVTPTATPTVTPTVTPTATSTVIPTATSTQKPPFAYKKSNLNWINAAAYTGAWKGSVYTLSDALKGSGYKLADFDAVNVTINLYENGNGGETKQLLTDKSKGGASIKVSNDGTWNDSDAFGVQHGMGTGDTAMISLAKSQGDTLKAVVQNSSENVTYIEIAEVQFIHGDYYEPVEDVELDGVKNYDALSSLAEEYGLKMGTVMGYRDLKNAERLTILKHHFNSMTAANEMKAYALLDQNASQEAAKAGGDGMPKMNYTYADKMMQFAKDNNIKVRGHALVWDADMCKWFFCENYENPVEDGEKNVTNYVDKETMKKRVKSYIKDVITHFETKFPGVIYCWDVVNEAVDPNNKADNSDLRCIENNIFTEQMGADYVELSFQYTKEVLKDLESEGIVADADAVKLYYNDFSTYAGSKCTAICELVKSINKNEKLCDGVGMQSYIGGWTGGTTNPSEATEDSFAQTSSMNPSDIVAIENAIKAFGACGVEVQVTELAVRNWSDSTVYREKHAEFYGALMAKYLQLAQGKGGSFNADKPLTAISIWGLYDDPSLAITDYSYSMNGTRCGLFTENYAVKPSFEKVYEVLGGE